MFNKKELEDIKSEIDYIKIKIDEQGIFMNEFKFSAHEELKVLSSRAIDANAKQVSYFDEFDKSLAVFNDINLKYRKEFDSLGSFKNQLAEKLLEKMSREMKEDLQKHFSKLELEKKQFETLSKELEFLKSEIQKLRGISETIKKIDFDLVNYSKKLLEQDDEKLKLMSQIDNLQKLVAKMRQGRHH